MIRRPPRQWFDKYPRGSGSPARARAQTSTLGSWPVSTRAGRTGRPSLAGSAASSASENPVQPVTIMIVAGKQPTCPAESCSGTAGQPRSTGKVRGEPTRATSCQRSWPGSVRPRVGQVRVPAQAAPSVVAVRPIRGHRQQRSQLSAGRRARQPADQRLRPARGQPRRRPPTGHDALRPPGTRPGSRVRPRWPTPSPNSCRRQCHDGVRRLTGWQ